ncbi:gustatory and pheromone receptor 39a-like [Episyrphus balteatus]|uniref:gustatory and pheromone receptor 39a-like n=1 Tax=Episyrphus balteatus TaxID=286459 RepID=UPI002484E2BB|nr:gustatory and pheromone receptor 39a-like [Episyrphus balteatus]
MLFCTILCGFYIQWIESDSYTFIGANFEWFVFTFSGFFEIIVNIFMFACRKHYLSVIQSVTRIESKYIRKEDITSDKSLKLLKVNVIVCVVSIINSLMLFNRIGYWSELNTFTPFMIYNLQTMFTGLITTFYSTLVVICKETIVAINKKLESEVVTNIFEIKQMLKDRDEIKRICQIQISWMYGIPLLYVLLTVLSIAPTGPFFAINELEILVKDLLSIIVVWSVLSSSIMWIAPSIIFPVMILKQDPSEEANKTARILSRISRRGTGIDKMVDKFLIKNMQQKPILTAYGFFPLNKRTLFNIFAAIFTYMVILIQFKDMENTNKLLASPKTTTEVSQISIT